MSWFWCWYRWGENRRRRKTSATSSDRGWRRGSRPNSGTDTCKALTHSPSSVDPGLRIFWSLKIVNTLAWKNLCTLLKFWLSLLLQKLNLFEILMYILSFFVRDLTLSLPIIIWIIDMIWNSFDFWFYLQASTDRRGACKHEFRGRSQRIHQVKASAGGSWKQGLYRVTYPVGSVTSFVWNLSLNWSVIIQCLFSFICSVFQLEVYRPLVSLVHNMVNMGSLYGGDNYMMASQYRKVSLFILSLTMFYLVLYFKGC